MKIDAHQHFWLYIPEDFDWIEEGMQVLARNYLPPDLAPLLESAGLDGSVAVQAMQTLAESEWLLQLAAENPWIKGVVGWVDLCGPQARAQLERFAAHPKFRGVRHVVQSEPDDRFMLREDFQRGIGLLGEFGLTYDLLVFPRQLPAAAELVARFPDQPFVLDHLAKPPIKAGQLSPWEADLRRLASSPNVFCKVSGMVTEADWKGWEPADFTPFLEVVFEAFGPQRVMFGSDWPVCKLAAGYEQVIELAADFIRRLSPDEQAAFWGGTASQFYGLGSGG